MRYKVGEIQGMFNCISTKLGDDGVFYNYTSCTKCNDKKRCSIIKRAVGKVLKKGYTEKDFGEG